MTSGSVAGAEMITFCAPASRCLAASSRLVKKPVDSITTSTPRSPHGSVRRVALGEHLDLARRRPTSPLVADLDGARERTVDRVVLEQVRERPGVRDVVDGDDLDVRVRLLRGAEDVAADAAEAVDPDAYGHLGSPLRLWTGPVAAQRLPGAAQRYPVDVAVRDLDGERRRARGSAPRGARRSRPSDGGRRCIRPRPRGATCPPPCTAGAGTRAAGRRGRRTPRAGRRGRRSRRSAGRTRSAGAGRAPSAGWAGSGRRTRGRRRAAGRACGRRTGR